MKTPTPSSLFDDLSKAELVEQLKAEKEKSEAFFRLIASMFHEFRNPVAVIRSYAQLLLVAPETERPALTEAQAKYVMNINLIAERLQKTQDFFSIALRTIQLLHEPPSQEKICLAELETLKKQVTDDLNSLPPIHASKPAISAIFDVLKFVKSDELEVRLEEDGDWICFNFSNFTNPPYWLERHLDKETNRLGCEESNPGKYQFALSLL